MELNSKAAVFVPASEKANNKAPKSLSSVGSDLNSSAEPFIPSSAKESYSPSNQDSPEAYSRDRDAYYPAEYENHRQGYPPNRQRGMNPNDAYSTRREPNVSNSEYPPPEHYQRVSTISRYEKPPRDNYRESRGVGRSSGRDRYNSTPPRYRREPYPSDPGMCDRKGYDDPRYQERMMPPEMRGRRPPRDYPDVHRYDHRSGLQRDRPLSRDAIMRRYYGRSYDPRDTPAKYYDEPHRRRHPRERRDTVQSYGDIVASSLEKNPWDAVGRPKPRNHRAPNPNIQHPPRSPTSPSNYRPEMSGDAGLKVYPKDAETGHAARERRKQEIRAAKMANFGIPSCKPQQQRVENVDFEIANTLQHSPTGRRKYEKQLQQQPEQPESLSPETKGLSVIDRENTDPSLPAMPMATSRLPEMKHGENKNWKQQLGVTEDIGANRWIRLRKQEDGIYTKGDPTLRKLMTHPERPSNQMEEKKMSGLVTAKIQDSKYAPAVRVKSNKRKVKFERLAPGVVVVRNAIDPDTQIWLIKIAKKEGNKGDHGFWETKKDGTKTLNSTGYRGRIYDKLETFEDGAELKHYAWSICEKTRLKFNKELPMVCPTHLLLLHYSTDKGIGWHADDAENDGQNDHPIISFCLGNTCSFGYRPIWHNHSTEDIAKMTPEEYKKHSYATDPEFVSLCSGDVILWGGIHRMLVHNVDRVTPNSSPGYLRQLVKNVRYNFTFRDCSNIAGREHEFKYYIPSAGKNEETRNFRTFDI